MTHDRNILDLIRHPFSKLQCPIIPKRIVIFNKDRGFSFVELIVVMAIVGALSTIALPAYYKYVDRTKVARALSEIHTLGGEISAYVLEKGALPPDGPAGMTAIGRGGYKDPWGRAYIYTNIGTGGTPLEGPIENLNTDFDLYSLGADGLSGTAYGAPGNADDICRFNDGNLNSIRE